MATKVGEAYYELTARNSKLRTKLRESDQATASWTKKMSGKLQAFGKKAFVAATAGVVALTAATIKATQMAAAEELQTAQLAHQLERLGLNSKQAMKEVNALADEQQAYTRFGDTDTRRMLSRLIMLTDNYKLSLSNVSLAQDMAESGIWDANSAVRMLGMALSGNIEILGRYIPELKTSNNESLKTMSTSEKVAFAVEVLRKKFGGLSRQIGTTGAGAWAKLKNAIGDAWEALGSGALEKANHDLRGMAGIVKDLEPDLKRLGATGVTSFNYLIRGADVFTKLVEAASVTLRKLFDSEGYEEMRLAQLALLDQQLQEEEALKRLQEARAEANKETPKEATQRVMEHIDAIRQENAEVEEYIQLFRERIQLQEQNARSQERMAGIYDRVIKKIEEAEAREERRQFNLRKSLDIAESAVVAVKTAQTEFLRSIGKTFEAERKMAKEHYDNLLKQAGKNIQARELIEAARAAKFREIADKEKEAAKKDAAELREVFRPELVDARELAMRGMTARPEKPEVEIKAVPSNEDLKHTQQFETMITVMEAVRDKIQEDVTGLLP